VVTLRDPVIPVHRQLDLFAAIPDARASRIDGEHDAIVAHAPRMADLIIDGVRSVTERRS
jgi:hypothetical protein